MDWVRRIISEAKSQGACNLANGVRTEEELINLFFSPQGREFCSLKAFPTISQWDEMDSERLIQYNIFVNAGRFGLDISSIKNIAVIGNTMAELYVKGTKTGHTIIVGHGADVTIYAADYAVFEVVRIGRCKVTTNLDDTAVEL